MAKRIIQYTIPDDIKVETLPYMGEESAWQKEGRVKWMKEANKYQIRASVKKRLENAKNGVLKKDATGKLRTPHEVGSNFK